MTTRSSRLSNCISNCLWSCISRWVSNWVSCLARLIATGLGLGYLPWAPGTWGTALAVALAFGLAGLTLGAYLAVVLLITVVGTWAASVADRAWGTHDSGRIVIDEVAGYLLTVALVDRARWGPLLAGFVVFRLLDILKPPPIRWLDRRVPGGFGVMLDDLAAGLLGAALLAILARLGLAPWRG
ncbi:MAG: phosphatidylglycerophosphatase A [Proteobacteria bacterium]|nr:phosphatidylglycerophosphatase A [Pseudomonadota bacterium]